VNAEDVLIEYARLQRRCGSYGDLFIVKLLFYHMIWAKE
jgi:hypothetical protein